MTNNNTSESARASEGDDFNFLKDMDRIIASSSYCHTEHTGAPPSLPHPSSSSSLRGKSGAHGGRSASPTPGDSDVHSSQLRKWTDEAFHHYGRRPRLLISFLQHLPNQPHQGSDLAPFLADVGFDVDISPAAGQSPSVVARAAVEADVHGVLLLHPSYGNSSITPAGKEENFSLEEGTTLAATPSPSAAPIPSSSFSLSPSVENVEEDLAQLCKELKKMNAEDVFLFYVGSEKGEGKTMDVKVGQEGQQHTAPHCSAVLANQVLYFPITASPTTIASTILKAFLGTNEDA